MRFRKLSFQGKALQVTQIAQRIMDALGGEAELKRRGAKRISLLTNSVQFRLGPNQLIRVWENPGGQWTVERWIGRELASRDQALPGGLRQLVWGH